MLNSNQYQFKMSTSFQVCHLQSQSIQEFLPFSSRSVKKCWESANPKPVGVLDHLEHALSEDVATSGTSPALTCHVFLPAQCRLVIGRDDGSIIMLPATQTIMLHLLTGKYHKYNTWPSHQVLRGHTARVNCLLYPNNSAPRYDMAHLVSGVMRNIIFQASDWSFITNYDCILWLEKISHLF